MGVGFFGLAVMGCAAPGGGGGAGWNCALYPTATVCVGRDVVGPTTGDASDVTSDVNPSDTQSTSLGTADTFGGETFATDSTPTDTQIVDSTVTDSTATDTQIIDSTATDTSVTDSTPTDSTPTDTHVVDTGPTDTADTHTDTDTTVSCDFNGFGGPAGTFSGDETSSAFEASSTDTTLYLQVSFFTPADGSAAASPLTGPGDYPLATTAADRDYKTCTTCVIAARQCDATKNCSLWFVATAGTVHVTDLDFAGGTISGSLEGVELEESTIDFSGDFTSTPVSGGSGWCLDSMPFSTP